MAFADRSLMRHLGVAALTASALCLAARPAAAENFFQMLFGGFHRQAPQPLPPQTSSYADPYVSPYSRGHIVGDNGGSFGHGTVFCVRTCDGRYFPLQRHAGVSPAEQCSAFCPAAKTMVFSGSKIDYAVAQNGTHYADLDNAFVYRDKVVSNCTCNGKEGGLAHLDTESDPTLRPGDIVATDQGFESYNGKSGARTGSFSPINPSSGELARKLSESKIRPAPPMQPATSVASGEPLRIHNGRLQAAK